MIIYIFVYIFSCLSAFVAEAVGSRKTALLFFVSVFTLVVGLRAVGVGIDTSTYLQIFQVAGTNPEHGYIQSLEPLYISLNQAVFASGVGFGVVQLVIAGLSSLFIAIAVYRLSAPVTLSVAIFLALGSFFFFHSGMRQGLAVALVFFSSVFIVERKPISFICVLLLAAGFHFTALIFAPFYFLSRLRLYSAFWLAAWAISLIFILKPGTILTVLDLLSAAVPPSYSRYFEDLDYVFSLSQGLGLRTILMQGVFLVYVFLNPVIRAQHREIFFLAMFAVLLFNVFYHASHIDRVVHYFSVFHMVAIPYAISAIFRGFDSYYVTFMIVIALFVLYFRQLVTDTYSVIPFYFNIPGLD